MMLPGLISLKIILFQVLPVFQIGINYFTGNIFFFLFGSCFFLLFIFVCLLLFFFLLSCFPSLSTGGPRGAFCPVGGEGRVTLLWRVHQTSVWCPSAGEFPVLGTVGPRDKFCPRKNGTPQSGLLESHARVEKVVLSFRLTASIIRGSRQSSFPFIERTFTGSPSEYKRFPPTGEKPQDPWGPS